MATTLRDRLQGGMMAAIDLAYASVPRRAPSAALLEQAHLVAHRGACLVEKENTLAAFDAALAAGAWGLELDLRLTGDGELVVLHDPDCGRVFGDAIAPGRLGFAALRARRPEVPALREVVSRYGGRAHLFLELKSDASPGWTRAAFDALAAALQPLRPVADYHLISLDAGLLLRSEVTPRSALLPVAEWNLEELSRLALRERLAGVSGHYLLTSNSLIRRHRDAGQAVGTGFAASRSVAFREVTRGVTWIFSNHSHAIGRLFRRPWLSGPRISVT